MLTFTSSDTKGRAIRRFKQTGGQPPQGAKLIGRWTAADFSSGFETRAWVAQLASSAIVAREAAQRLRDRHRRLR
jgi:hypothetical protein